MKRLSEFLKRCRQQLKNDSKLFWVSLQSNALADLSSVANDFKISLLEMQEELQTNGWMFPALQANMRNQVNIAKVQVENGSLGSQKMKPFLELLQSGSSLIGEVPLLYQMKECDWDQKKDEVLQHCIGLMSQKSEKNVVVLWDSDYSIQNLGDYIKRVIKDKTIVTYPSKQSKEDGTSNIKQFVEKSDHILVTRNRYFNGCECPNVILVSYGNEGIRNSVLRCVQNIICILIQDFDHATVFGMKEDRRFVS